MTYIEPGTEKAITLEQVKEYFKDKNIKEEDYFNYSDFVGLNDALLNNRSVFAVCEKYPARLDKGKHYYSVYYINEHGQTCIFWFIPIMDRQDRYKYIRRFCFYSSAIGMSRVLDATNIIFNTLKKIGGCYAQIECI